MSRLATKKHLRSQRARRVRNVIRGTEDRPRLVLNISNKAVGAQLINDLTGETLVGDRSAIGSVSAKICEEFGAQFAKKAKKAKISKVVLDRGSRKYHGRVNAFAEAARKEGLEF